MLYLQEAIILHACFSFSDSETCFKTQTYTNFENNNYTEKYFSHHILSLINANEIGFFGCLLINTISVYVRGC